MDPLDPARNEETSGFSRRRISSILKAPRKSIICVGPEQEENVVECPKPVEKRNSRRVSFAPANNVLLFSNEDKNASSVRSPLQDLITTTTATQNRVQIAEDGIQEITGMETLLNAPLHTPQQKEKVMFHTEDVFGEKTVMFSTEDALMDMTHCQTINIANNAELLTDMSLRSHDLMLDDDYGAMGVTPKSTESVLFGSRPLPTSRNTDPNSDIISISSTVPSLDPGFENFLASLFHSNGPPSKNPEVTTAGTSSEMQQAEVDKENQLPPSVLAVMGGSLNASRKMDRSLHGSVMTKAVQAFPEDDCSSFPTKEVFSHFDPTSQLKQQQNSGAAAPFPMKDKMKLKTHQRDAETLDKTIMFSAGDEFMDITQSHTVNIANGSLARTSQNQTMDNSSSQKEQQHDTQSLSGASVSGWDHGFKDFIADLSKTKSEVGGHEIRFNAEDDCRDKTVRFSADDACMDITQSHTVNIATHDMCAESGRLKSADMNLRKQDKRILSLPDYKKMETSMSASLKTGMEGTKVKFDGRDKTLTASAEETIMDVTQSHTVNIISDLRSNPQQDVDFLPGFGEKTVRFGANEENMDETLSHTVNILTGFKTKTPEKTDPLPAFGEKTVTFGAMEAAMDVTQSHTVNIICGLDFQSQQHEQRASPGGKIVTFPACDAAVGETRSCTMNTDTDFKLYPDQNADFIPMIGEKTVKFAELDASMDITRSHTVNISSDLKVHLHQNEEGLPSDGGKTLRLLDCDGVMDAVKSQTVKGASDLNFYFQYSQPASGEESGASGEETVMFVADDAAMDETQSLTVNISTGLNLQSHQNLDCLPAIDERTVRFSAVEAEMDVTRSHTVNIASDLGVHSQPPSHKKTNLAEMDVAQNHAVTIEVTSGMDADLPHRDPVLLCSEENMEFPLSLKKKNDEMGPAPGLFSDAVDPQGVPDQLGPQNLSEVEKEAQEKPVGETVLDCPAVSLEVATTGAQMGHNLDTDVPPQGDSVKSCETKSTCMELSPKDVLDADLTGNMEGCEPRKHKSPKSEDDGDAEPSRKSRRMSFADLHSKIRRLSHMVSAAPDSLAAESCVAPVPQEERDVDRNDQEKTESSRAMGLELGPALEKNEGDQNDVDPTTTAAETPFKLKTKQLMSRLSMGGFKAKLPQRTSGRASVGEHTKTLTVNTTEQLRDLDADVSDINDEELDSCEDMSDVLVTKSPHKARVKLSPPKDFNTDRPLEDYVFEDDLISAAHGNKKLLPTDEDTVVDESRTGFNMGSQSCLGDCNTNITSAPSAMSQTTDESSSHSASLRCEATFESTFKQSLFESQLEDYASAMQRKFDDGTITVLEFFKLFNIDFVIHNPRQSILPERLPSDTERTPLESMKDRHIHHPRHKVYEANVLGLTQKVEGLKERMHDLDKPLRIVNKTLWEEMSCYTEKELKSFGAKLKQRNNFFRKTSKIQSHQMKETLYLDLVQSNQAEQQSLRETIEKADEMIRTLDGCICELEAELDQVVEKGSEDSSSLKSLQHEINNVNEAMKDDERQISELEVQMTQNSKKLKKLKAETENLENHVAALHMISEWRSGDTSDRHTVYTFLYDTFHLQLSYENPNEKVADNDVKKISHIVFQHHIDEEKSQDHARIVHKLLSQYTHGGADWVQKYPTDRHVPKLLHDVSLVVGHCRLLGEELRRLKMWGGLRLDILSISCVDTLIHVVFSSLKKLVKFEVIFSVSLSDHHYILQLHSFKNMIGGTTFQQVEDIAASLMPGKNLLTKTIKKMFENLLR